MVKQYTVVTTPHADIDILENQNWYDEQELGLGDYFLDKMLEFRGRLSIYPLRFPRVHGQVRRGKLSKFQNHVYFIIERQRITIIAVVHGRRHPNYWKKKL